MKNAFVYLAALMYCFISCTDHPEKTTKENIMVTNDSSFKSGYADVNGIKMYYERSGKGPVLVLLHGGGSTIETSFGRIIPLLNLHYDVIAVELQNHGRTGTRDVAETFEQDADDVVALLKNLGIDKANFFGFSNGGTSVLQIGIRHPEIINNLIVAAATYKRDGLIPGFFEGMSHASLSNMPVELKEGFLKVNTDSSKLQHMFEKDRDRMINFKDISDEDIKSLKAPALIINGDKDVITIEHAVKMHRLIGNSELAIIPGEHGKYIGEITTIKDGNKDYVVLAGMIKNFLDKQNPPAK